MIFSVMSYITKIMFYIRCYPNETIMVLNCDAMNMGYSYVNDAKRNFIYKQLHKYRPSY